MTLRLAAVLTLSALAYAVAISLYLSRPATAQAMTCDHYPTLAERLASEFGEMPLARGLDWRGSIAEWWANPETGTWSLVTLSPQGYACIPAHGTSYEAVRPVAQGVDG
jgi:hypothetical protein